MNLFSYKEQKKTFKKNRIYKKKNPVKEMKKFGGYNLNLSMKQKINSLKKNKNFYFFLHPWKFKMGYF